MGKQNYTIYLKDFARVFTEAYLPGGTVDQSAALDILDEMKSAYYGKANHPPYGKNYES